MRSLRLHHRIVIPFVLVALVTTSLIAYVALSLASGTLESGARAQLRSAATVVGRSDLALNPAVLRNFRDATGAEAITFRAGGEIIATTLEGPNRSRVIEAVRAAARAHSADPGRGTTSVFELDCGVPCFVAVRQLDSRPDISVALVADTAELAAAQTSIARSIALAALLSALVTVFVSQVVARRVTAPLDRLVAFTRDVAPAGTRRRAEVGHDEIGHLATAFNEMLDRLDQSRDALVRSEKLGLAGLLAARVAHDIRNPLSSIKMQTQIVRGRLPHGSDDEAALAAVLHDIDQVESVIRDLLELAKPGTMARVPTDLNEVVRGVLAQLGAQFTHRRIAVALDFAATLPAVDLDARRFTRALVNVLVNASDAMTTGGTIEVATRSAGEAIELSIADDGTGIDPAMLDRVFDPFVSTKPDGIGLGLVNARSVVESHGGTITLQARQPRGTCAIIRLPVSASADAAATTVPRNSDG